MVVLQVCSEAFSKFAACMSFCLCLHLSIAERLHRHRFPTVQIIFYLCAFAHINISVIKFFYKHLIGMEESVHRIFRGKENCFQDA